MRLKTLGGVALVGTSFRRPKALLLLAYLAVEGPRERQHLRELFWPEAADPASSLRVVVSQLRGACPEVLTEDGTRLALGLPSDVADLSAAFRDTPGRVPELYTGAFLDGLTLTDWSAELEEWVFLTREFLATQVRATVLQQAQVAAARGQPAAGAALAERAWRLPGAPPMDPDDLRVVHGLLGAGSLGAAVRLEARELGLVLAAPEHVLVAAPAGIQRIIREAPGEAPESGLPAASSVFIGRGAEVQDLQLLLADPETRLLTLLGPGGIGKTRLAMELARGQVGERTVYVGLETVQDAAQVAGVIAGALHLTFGGPEQALAALIQALRNASLLLVLDNFEQVLSAGPELSALLDACPGLTLLVTSRAPLNIRLEFVYPVPGLQISAREDADAVRLFQNRARRADARFRLTSEHLPQVVQICRRVDGSPLGIELAAAWVRSLSVEQIHAELTRSVDLLENPAAGTTERHRSVRQVFMQSWARLTPEEQALLSGLSVFQGGFTREAAAALLGATLPQLLALVDASFLKVDGRGRFDRHPLLYEYVWEQLAAQPERRSELELRHARSFQEMSDAAHEALFTGVDLMRHVVWLDTEYTNMLAALETAWSHQDIELGLWLCRNLNPQFYSRNFKALLGRYLQMFLNKADRFRETLVYRWGVLELILVNADISTWNETYADDLRRLIESAEDVTDAFFLNRAYFAQAFVSRAIYFNANEAMNYCLRAIDIGSSHGFHASTVEDLSFLAELKTATLDLDAAKTDLDLAIRIADEHGIGYPSAGARALLSRVALYRGRYDEAEQAILSTDTSSFVSNFVQRENFYIVFGMVYMERSRISDRTFRSDMERALVRFEQSMLYRQGWKSPGKMVSFHIGDIMVLSGTVDDALVYISEGLTSNDETGFPHLKPGWHLALGRALKVKGKGPEALTNFKVSLSLARNLYMRLVSVELIAATLGQLGQGQMAATLLGAAAAFRQAKGLPLAPVWQEWYEADLAHIRAGLGEAAFAQFWAEGTGLDLTAAIDLAQRAGEAGGP